MPETIHKKYPDVISGISEKYNYVSINYVLKNGVANVYADKDSVGTKVDLKTKSEGQQVIEGMIKKCQQRIDESPGLQALLNKETWKINDRIQWEASISDIARDLIAEEPRFGKYRLDDKKDMRTPITEITKDTNFHCEPMAILTSVLVQRMENENLSENSPEDSYKRRQSYYLGGGIGNRAPHNSGEKPIEYIKKAGSGGLLHAYIVSPITGNVIEGTQGRPNGWTGGAESTYQVTGYTFARCIAGFPISTNRESDYTYGYAGDEKAKALAQSRLEAVNRNDFKYLEDNRANDESLGDQYAFLNVSNYMRANRVGEGSYYRLEGADAMAYAEQITSKELAERGGRSYKQLVFDSNQLDFSMTAIELERARQGNAALLWAGNNPNELRLFAGKGNERLRKQHWDDQKLVDYLESQGAEDVWLFKPLPKGQTFDDFTRAMFDMLPANKKTYMDKDGKETPIKFEDYLALSRERIKLDDKETQETMVPVLMNPKRAVSELQDRPGRDHLSFLVQDIAAGAMTSVSVYDNPGTDKDMIQFTMEAAMNGFYMKRTSECDSIKIDTKITPPPPSVKADNKDNKGADKPR